MIDVTGLFTVTGMLGVVASFALITGVSSLFAIYVLPLLTPTVIEIAVHGISIALMWSDQYFAWTAHTELFLVFLGCMALCPALLFSISLHGKKNGSTKLAVQIIAATCSFVWGYHAIRLQSQLLGLFACGALFVLLGFMVTILPFCYVVGFDNDAVMLRCMNVAFYLLHIYVYATIHDFHNSRYFYPFKQGVLLLGGFVYFLGCLIISNKYYSWENDVDVGKYFRCNVLALGSGFVALTLGSMIPALHYLRGIGGTFFVIMVVEKYIEIPWGEKYWAWGITGFGGVLYGLVQCVHQYPDLIVQMPN